MFLKTISRDLQNVLGMKTFIDCSESEKSTKQSKNRPVISKTVEKFPTDLSVVAATQFFCFAIWCKMKSLEIAVVHC